MLGIVGALMVAMALVPGMPLVPFIAVGGLLLGVAWMLRNVEGHALQEVADACGCSLATAKRRIALAQRRVREVFGDE